MLYDPKWTAPVKCDPFSIESLVAWLKTMPPEREYCYVCNDNCVLAQYFTAQGFEGVRMQTNTFLYIFMKERVSQDLPFGWNAIALSPGRTYGAALTAALRHRDARA